MFFKNLDFNSIHDKAVLYEVDLGGSARKTQPALYDCPPGLADVILTPDQIEQYVDVYLAGSVDGTDWNTYEKRQQGAVAELETWVNHQIWGNSNFGQWKRNDGTWELRNLVYTSSQPGERGASIFLKAENEPGSGLALGWPGAKWKWAGPPWSGNRPLSIEYFYREASVSSQWIGTLREYGYLQQPLVRPRKEDQKRIKPDFTERGEIARHMANHVNKVHQVKGKPFLTGGEQVNIKSCISRESYDQLVSRLVVAMGGVDTHSAVQAAMERVIDARARHIELTGEVSAPEEFSDIGPTDPMSL